jgi:hypothetical protein
MPKWEYCLIVGMTQVNPEYPVFYRITSKGYEIANDFKKLPKDVLQKDAVAMLIAQLGEDGWEMVGTGATREGTSHSIYFKRQIELLER